MSSSTINTEVVRSCSIGSNRAFKESFSFINISTGTRSRIEVVVPLVLTRKENEDSLLLKKDSPEGGGSVFGSAHTTNICPTLYRLPQVSA